MMNRIPKTLVGGASLFVLGTLLRCCARRLAWPEKWTYSGERINTAWANQEAIYTDLSYFIVALGIALIVVGLLKRSEEGS